MFSKYSVGPFMLVLALALSASSLSFAFHPMDDVSDAWESASTMVKFIGMGDPAGTERAGNDAITSIDKAIDKQEDSGKRDKLRDAQKYVREALSYAKDGKWDYADGSGKKAVAILEALM